MSYPENFGMPTMRLRHADLARVSEESAYRSRCPVCPKGVLLVRREHPTLALTNEDYCVSCGQHVVYTDTFIAGERVLPPLRPRRST